MVRFRPNVAALMVRPESELLLICERSTVSGAWQFPQGGVDPGESLEEALFREVREEIGLLPEHYSVARMIDGYRYLYPAEVRGKKVKKHGYHGQAQTYFLCHLNANAPEVNVDQKPREFSSYRWIHPEEFDLEWVPQFKREVYKRVMNDFFGVIL
jgi:putative (di)nucleoside polyphosphate hydrolase